MNTGLMNLVLIVINQKQFKMEKLGKIQDVRIIIKADDKHYALTPRNQKEKELARGIRISILEKVLNTHDVVIPALEDIKSSEV